MEYGGEPYLAFLLKLLKSCFPKKTRLFVVSTFRNKKGYYGVFSGI